MTSERLDATFAALADSTRRAILERLSGGEATVTELAAPFDISAPAITKHLKVLEKAGLITRSREGQWRPCQLATEPLREAADWVGQYRKFWEQNLDNLEDYLRELQARTQPPTDQTDDNSNPKSGRDDGAQPE